MLPETASSTEWWWTLMAVPGVLLSVWNVWGAGCDLREHWRSPLRTLGWIGLGKVALVLLLGAIVVWVGLIALTTPPPIQPENVEAAAHLANLFLVLDAAILALAVLFFIERRHVAADLHVMRRAREARARRATR